MKRFLLASLLATALPLMAGSTDRSWPLFSPGSIPPGRIVSVQSASDLPENSTDSVYLVGEFIVTASSTDRAVLRPVGDPLIIPRARIIVSYPPGGFVPGEKTVFLRDEDRPFQIVRVERTPDGIANIYAREIVR